MNRNVDDLELDREIERLLRSRAEDTHGIRDATTMTRAIADRVPGNGRDRGGISQMTLILVVLALLVVLAASVVMSGGSHPPAEIPAEVSLETDASVGWIAYSRGGRDASSDIYLVHQSRTPQQIAGTDDRPNGGSCPAFSPDGTKLLYGMAGGSFILMSIDEQGEVPDSAQRLRTLGSERNHCATWAPDGTRVAYLDGSILRIVPLEGPPSEIDGWEVEGDVSATSNMINFPPQHGIAWSPNGATVAIARPSGTWLVPLDGGEARRLHPDPAYSVAWSPDGSAVAVAPAVQGKGSRIVPVDGSRRIVDLGSDAGVAAWSPTGERIAFPSEDGVVVARADGSGASVVSDYGYNVSWSADGTRVQFTHDVASAAYAFSTAAASGAGDPALIVPSIGTTGPRAFPGLEGISWQPIWP